MQERDSKIAYLNGTGQNPNGYTNAIYGQTTQQVLPGAEQQVVMPETKASKRWIIESLRFKGYELRRIRIFPSSISRRS